VVCVPLGSLLTASVNGVNDSFTGGQWDRFHWERGLSTHLGGFALILQHLTCYIAPLLLPLIGPMRPNGSWQTKVEGAYDLSQFRINWKTRQVTCPQGKKSCKWIPSTDTGGNPFIHVRFLHRDCRICPTRTLCTRSATEARALGFRPKAEYEVLQRVRQQQQTPAWQKRYNQRAGVEGTLSQGIHCFGLRRTRYIGLAKTHLQHVLISIAMNITRITSWLMGIPHARTRISHFAALANDSPLGAMQD
jgi:transposase